MDRLIPKVKDPEMQSEVRRAFNRVYDLLSQLENRTSAVESKPIQITPELQKQLAKDAVNLLGGFAQPLIGATADPLLASVAQAPGTGTVTSFSATPSGIFDVANPTTTPALSLDNQAANIVLAGPTTGGAATPAFRALVNADLPAIAWASWTPTWTNLSVGNGTVVAKYGQIGKLVVCRLSLIFGTTTSVSGNITFSLPVTSVSYAGNDQSTELGGGSALDAGVLNYKAIIVWHSTTTAIVRALDTSATYCVSVATSATIPFAWGTSDEIDCQFFYEAA